MKERRFVPDIKLDVAIFSEMLERHCRRRKITPAQYLRARRAGAPLPY